MTFAEQFIRGRGKPIDVGGLTVVQMLRVPVQADDRVRVLWRAAIADPVQGIRLRLRGGSLAIDGRSFDDIVLWRDTAPDEVGVRLRHPAIAELQVWNCWRDDRGVTQAWIGNAGMVLQDAKEGRYTAACNSRSAITFQDLAFEIVVERGSR